MKRFVAVSPLRVLALVIALASRDAYALDKQGSAHGGTIDPDANGFNVSGALMIGVAPINRTYAARPVLRQRQRHAQPDAAGGARDQGCLALQHVNHSCSG